MLVVSEDEGSIDVCAVLRGELDRQVSLVLTITADTAGRRDISSSFKYTTAAGSGLGSGLGLGAEMLEVEYTFTSGLESGSTVCNAIGISRDSVVENTEQFTVFLQGNPEDDAINITSGEAVIFINDSSLDCMFAMVLVLHIILYCFICL